MSAALPDRVDVARQVQARRVYEGTLPLASMPRLRGALASNAFDTWLQHVLLELSPADREQALLQWSEAPYARMAHPREDHLVPLWVALGAAEQEAAACVYHEESFFGALTVSSFRFGNAAA